MNPKNLFKKTQKIFEIHWRKWTILAILGMIIYLGFTFYKYIYKPIYKPQATPFLQIEIKQDIYEKVMEVYFQKQENLNEILNKNYLDIFK